MGGTHLKCCPPPFRDPHLYNPSLLRPTPSPLAADLYFSSRLLLYTFIKSTFRDGNPVGALHRCLFQKQSCSSCLHLSRLLASPFSFFLFLFFPFPFPFLFLFFPFWTVLPILCIFPRKLKETGYERLLFNLYDVPLSSEGKHTRCIVQ